MGGYAPHRLVTKLGLNHRTGQPLVSYMNERRISTESADAELSDWLRYWRKREKSVAAPPPGPV
jgi:hypothetical protein